MSRSNKPEVIRSIFFARWDKRRKRLSRSVVTLPEVSHAIAEYNATRPEGEHLSTRNPANFMKDFIRNTNRANQN